MGYAVFHRDEAGTPTVEDVASLEAALEIVERSRNGDGPEDVRVFREVPIEVRTYYKVQVAEDADAPLRPAADTDAAAPAEPATDEAGQVAADAGEVAADAVPVADEVVPVAADAGEVADEVVPVAATAPPEADLPDEQAVPVVTAEVPVIDGDLTAVTDEPYDVRRLLEPASDADRPAPPPAVLPGAFPLAGPAVQQPTVEVHAANLEDEDAPAKRHSLFGRGG